MNTITATNLSKMNADEIFKMIDGADFLITLDRNPIGIISEVKPKGNVQVMTFSEFKRNDKKDLRLKLKRRPVKIVSGFGDEKEREFYCKKF